LTTDQKGAIPETAIIPAAVKLGIGIFKPISNSPAVGTFTCGRLRAATTSER